MSGEPGSLPRNRRDYNHSPASQASWSAYETADLIANLELQEKLDFEADASPKQQLRYMLSVNSVVLISSLSAQRMTAHSDIEKVTEMQQIGAGSCGIVFGELGQPHAIKFALAGWNDGLWNEFQQQTEVVNAFQDMDFGAVRTPEVKYFIDPGNSSDAEMWWAQYGHLVPTTVMHPGRTRPSILVTQRILPVPLPIRKAIISEWCPDHLKPRVSPDGMNRDCLIRPYLGTRRNLSGRPQLTFGLRNYSIHLDQIEELGAISQFTDTARSMGQALAIMHWRAGIDARDVEFVLGSVGAPSVKPLDVKEVRKLSKFTPTYSRSLGHNFKRRALHLWVLDFNQCRKIQANEQGIKTAIDAFFTNDKYCPRPDGNTANEKALWQAFKEAYIEMGVKAITRSTEEGLPFGRLDASAKDLPEKFIDACFVEKRRLDKRRQEAERRSSSNM